MMNKKGNFTYIQITIALVILALIFLIFFTVFKGLSKDKEDFAFEDDIKDIQDDIDKIKAEFDSSIVYPFELYPETDKICFLDYSKKDLILQDDSINEYPLIKNVLLNNISYNIFFFKEGNLYKTYNLKDFCITKYPHFFCKDNDGEGFDLNMKGIGSCADLDIDWKLFDIDPNNVRISALNNPSLFLIDRDNSQKNRLLTLTLALWRDISTINYHSFSVINDNFNEDSLKNFIENKSKINNYYFDYTGNDIPGITITSIDKDSYTNFWQSYGTVVLVHESNINSWLISALFASNINAPIFFISDYNIDEMILPTSPIYGKRAYVVDELTFDREDINKLETALYENQINFLRSSDLKASYNKKNPFRGIIGDISLN